MEKNMIIKSIPDNLRLVEKFIDEFSEELKLSDEIYGNVLISTLEAVNNAIVHGNKKNSSLNVEINMKHDEKSLKISIKDQGKGFDFNGIPDPTAPENLEKINGRGVFLMNKLSDGIEFLDNGSLVIIFFNTEV